MQHTTISREQPSKNATYVPPSSEVISAFARELCTGISAHQPDYTSQEVVSGFTAFFTFVSHKLAKYMNSGHKPYLLEGYTSPKPLRKGDHNVREKIIQPHPTHCRTVLRSKIVDAR
jgi:hypothetical protein